MKIAITGKMCSGKSTVASYISSLNPLYQTFSFGQKVKNVASDLFNMDPKNKNRTLLTSIGTKMREIDPNVWINYIVKQTQNQDFCIIDDLRYQNEYESLIQNNFKIIQLYVSPKIQEQRIKEIYPQNYQDHLNNRNHPSELNIFQWSHNQGPHLFIDTSKSIDEIKITIQEFLNIHLKNPNDK
tara:strand:+ start:526 stop:1077 length:552 start_codon:yes stop_codon:yes gene_type:complete